LGTVTAAVPVGLGETEMCAGILWAESPACDGEAGFGVPRGVLEIGFGGIGGAVVGAFVGSLFEREQWVNVAVDHLRIDVQTPRWRLIATAPLPLP
jgi:hypothetical protein